MLAFAFLNCFSAVGAFFKWLRVAIDPARSFARPTAWEVFFDSTREMTLSLGLLAVPLAILFLQGVLEAKINATNKAS
jgi:hypothetical protein